MKRKINSKDEKPKIENSKKSRPVESPSIDQEARDDTADWLGADHPAWPIIISKLDMLSQMRLMLVSNARIIQIIEENAQSKIRKYRRQIQNDKYM